MSTETFTDLVIEGVALGAATGALMLVGELLEGVRSRSMAASRAEEPRE